MRPSLMRVALGSLVGALALSAPAHAAFAPALDVSVSPTRAGAVSSVAAAVQQVPGNTPLRRVSLRFPPGFGLNLRWAGTLCDAAAEAATACPSDANVGQLHVVSALGVTASGTMFLGPGGRLVAFVYDPTGILNQTIVGSVRVRGESIDINFDSLPAVPLAGVALRTTHGRRGLIVNPDTCGKGSVLGLFTSQADELAAAADEVTIDGCVEKAIVSRARVTRKRFRAARTRADRRRRGYGTALVWSQTETNGPTRVYIERRLRGRWRRARSVLVTARGGRNVLRFDGRVRNRPLRPGSYRFRIRPAGTKRTRSVRFTVLRPRR